MIAPFLPHPIVLTTDTVTGEYTATCERPGCEWVDVSHDYFGQLDRRISHERTDA